MGKTTIDHSRGQKFQGDPPTTMAPKRKHEETELEEAVHPSRQFQVPGSQPKPKKPRKFEPPVYKKQAHASSVNAINRGSRDTKISDAYCGGGSQLYTILSS